MDNSLKASLISGGGGLLTSGINAFANARQNKKMREYNDMAYEREKNDKLAQWTIEQNYNHPKQQMQRLREAGLNPHLVYGKGADNTASSISSTQTKDYNPKEIQFDTHAIPAAVGQYFDARQQTAQTDNIHALTTLAHNQASKTAAETLYTLQNTKGAEQQFENQKKLIDGQVLKLNLENDLLQINKKYAETNALQSLANQRAQELQTLAQTAKTNQEKQNLQQQIGILKSEQSIKALDAELAKRNIKPSDPLYMRIVQDWLINPVNNMRDYLDKWYNNK